MKMSPTLILMILKKVKIICGIEKQESIHELDLRINTFKKFIEARPEKNIALISHASFVGQMKDKHIKYIENGEEELKHCYPYLIKI